jgi:hypothetical protein
MIDPLAAAQARENSGFFVDSFNRHQNRQRFADHLFGRVAEDTFGAAVPGLNYAIGFLLMMAPPDDSAIVASR